MAAADRSATADCRAGWPASPRPSHAAQWPSRSSLTRTAGSSIPFTDARIVRPTYCLSRLIPNAARRIPAVDGRRPPRACRGANGGPWQSDPGFPGNSSETSSLPPARHGSRQWKPAIPTKPNCACSRCMASFICLDTIMKRPTMPGGCAGSKCDYAVGVVSRRD